MIPNRLAIEIGVVLLVAVAVIAIEVVRAYLRSRRRRLIDE